MGQGNTLAAVLNRKLSWAMICVAMLQAVEKAVGLRDKSTADNGTILQHILQIDQITVVHMLGKIIRVVKMDDALLMGLHDIRRKQNTAGDILADLACHIVALYAVDSGVLIGILLLDFLIITFNQA